MNARLISAALFVSTLVHAQAPSGWSDVQQKGFAFLMAQHKDGAFGAMGRPDVGITALCLAAMESKPREMRTEQEISWLRRGVEEHGCIEYARDVAHAMAGAAMHEGTHVYRDLPDSRDKRFLEALPRWVLARA